MRREETRYSTQDVKEMDCFFDWNSVSKEKWPSESWQSQQKNYESLYSLPRNTNSVNTRTEFRVKTEKKINFPDEIDFIRDSLFRFIFWPSSVHSLFRASFCGAAKARTRLEWTLFFCWPSNDRHDEKHGAEWLFACTNWIALHKL